MAGSYTKFGDPAPNAAKSGEGYDRCPVDGCIETEHVHKNGGVDAHGGSHYDWFMYNADPRQGGCGATWTRDTAQGYRRNVARGIHPKYVTQSAETGRVISVPSQTFQDNYARIFGHD